MDCCSPEKEKEISENVKVIRRNIEDVLWKIQDLDSIESQEKYTVALFKKLSSCSTIDDLANTSIDIVAAVQKVKLAQEKEEEKQEDGLFIKIFDNADVEETNKQDGEEVMTE